MGNYQFISNSLPKPGSVMTIVDNEYTRKQEIPKSVMFQGTKAKVIETKVLLCSRPDAPKVGGTLIQLPNGQKEVVFSNNLN